MQRFSLPALEYHLAHGCNLSCQQCSHYSNFRLAGKLPTLADAESEYLQWSHRLKPTRFALLGGEPLLNPAILEHIQLARQHWYDSELMLVTNGFFLLIDSQSCRRFSLTQSANLRLASMAHIKTTSNDSAT